MNNARAPLLVGNWKLNGTPESISILLRSLLEGISRSNSVQRADMVVLPPTIFISQVAQLLTGTPINWGAQDVSSYAEGAYTGDVSSTMLRAFNCRYVLLGHSERRRYYQENSVQLKRKLVLAKAAGLIPIFCIGDTALQYQKKQTETALLDQLSPLFDLDKAILQKLILAYEPYFSIGTGTSLAPERAQKVHQWLRTIFHDYFGPELAHQIRILYGGSVKNDNAAALFSMPDVDGGLVGKAALSADTFLQIYHTL